MTRPEAPVRMAEHRIGQFLIRWTYLAVALLAIGVVLLLAAGLSPLTGGPNLDLAALLPAVLSLEPVGFLWLGLLAVIAAPIGRVLLALLDYGGRRDWTMVAVGLGILGVVVAGIVVAVAATV